VLRTAEEFGFERFHLVGYSGGGASSVAFAAKHPGRLLSLALLEPAWMGNDELSPEEQEVWREFDRIATLPVVLVTARGTDEDRAHGLRIGANAYLVKSSFDQTVLLQTIARLL